MIVYGHRGAKGEAPENTLPGFRFAYGQGVRHFELDLVLSKDGVPVLLHDLTVDRTTESKGNVSQYTAAELAAMDTRPKTRAWPVKAGIPSLEAFLDEFEDLEHVQLEVKKDSRARLNILCNRLTEIIQRRNLYQTTAVTSSDTWLLREISRRNTRIRTGLVAERRFPKPLGLAVRSGCDYLCINWKLCSPALVESARRKGIHVSCWTVNGIQDMLKLETMGVDSVITDYPTSTLLYFDNRARSGLLLPEREENIVAGNASLPAS
ncbi:glycerophosphodiester phosphodiesterase [Marinobacter piscensis]|uniref:glycerophosphodiester phosphodiesterase n=1 Tax=Marinobacter piscensis TaxID=1562308 RepID=UPI0011A83B04|nr:glycerophosphodiester phosphodiesterase [Marinobacter piscensis]